MNILQDSAEQMLGELDNSPFLEAIFSWHRFEHMKALKGGWTWSCDTSA